MVEMLMHKLDRRFPHSDVLSAFGILYPQYWLQQGAEEAFPRYLQVLKNRFCGPRMQCRRTLGDLTVESVGELLSSSALDIQQSLFKITMKSQSRGCMLPSFTKNPFTWLWEIVGSSQILDEHDFGVFEVGLNWMHLCVGVGGR